MRIWIRVRILSHCRKKISSGLYAMNAAKRTLGTDHLRKLYFSLIHPYISYGNLLWGKSYQKHIRQIETLQKKAIRIITKSSYNEHTSPLYRRMGILKLADIHDLSIYLFMYDFVHYIVPRPLETMFKYKYMDMRQGTVMIWPPHSNSTHGTGKKKYKLPRSVSVDEFGW